MAERSTTGNTTQDFAGDVVSLHPTEPAHLADAVRQAGCTAGTLNGASRGLVVTGGVPASELEQLLSRHSGLEWVQLPSAGVESFLPAIRSDAGSRVTWTSAKGAYAQPVAEHAIALSLALLRILQRRARTSSWSIVPEGTSLAGLNVVVIGAGGIGVEIIRLLNAFGADITVVRRRHEAVAGAKLTVRPDRLTEVLATADLVIIAAALTESTAGLLGASEFDAMKSGVNIVNIARGGLIDTEALVTALRSGQVAGAALDVTEPEPLPDGHALWSEPGVLITPHSADTPEMTAPLLAERVRTNATALRNGGGFVGVVDAKAGY
jgi:phosphoglycerate dehydrogenase-like enzyme